MTAPPLSAAVAGPPRSADRAGSPRSAAVAERGPAGGDRGQAAVELALVLPLVVLVLLAVVQIGLVVRDQVLVVHAAREAARQAAVDPSPDGPRKAALAGSGLDADRLEVVVSGRAGAGSRVTVALKYRTPATVPLVGPALGDLTLEAEATMRVEH